MFPVERFHLVGWSPLMTFQNRSMHRSAVKWRIRSLSPVVIVLTRRQTFRITVTVVCENANFTSSYRCCNILYYMCHLLFLASLNFSLHMLLMAESALLQPMGHVVYHRIDCIFNPLPLWKSDMVCPSAAATNSLAAGTRRPLQHVQYASTTATLHSSKLLLCIAREDLNFELSGMCI